MMSKHHLSKYLLVGCIERKTYLYNKEILRIRDEILHHCNQTVRLAFSFEMQYEIPCITYEVLWSKKFKWNLNRPLGSTFPFIRNTGDRATS